MHRSDAPAIVGEMFRAHRERCGTQIEAICQMLTHVDRWELQLLISGSLQRSQVCRSQDDVLDLAERWKISMLENGWR